MSPSMSELGLLSLSKAGAAAIVLISERMSSIETSMASSDICCRLLALFGFSMWCKLDCVVYADFACFYGIG